MMDGERPVLVTGGAGFAGSYVTRRLLDGGFRVVVLDLTPYQPESRFVIGESLSVVPFEHGSIDDWTTVLDAVRRHRPGAIVHLGSMMDVKRLDRNPMLALKVNVVGTANVYEAARMHEVSRVIVFSTIGVHGRVMYEPIDGNHPTITARVGPVGAYSAGKLANEAFAYAYQQSFGLDARIVRPSALYGFGMSWFAPNYIKQIVEPAVLGQPVRLRSGGPVPRDYVNVVDLAALVLAILEGPDDADRVFYAATGRPLRTGGDVGRIVQELIPDADIEIAEEWTESDRAESAFRGQISIDNAREQLGWQPQFADLREGIADYVVRLRRYLGAGGTPSPRRPPELEDAPGG